MDDVAELRDISWTSQKLTVEWSDHQNAVYDAVWLRDNCVTDRDASNGQRLIDVVDLPADPGIQAAVLQGSELLIAWLSEKRIDRFDVGWLRKYRSGSKPEWTPTTRLWPSGPACATSSDFTRSSCGDLFCDADVRLNWLTALLRDGLAFVDKVPPSEGSVRELGQLLGIIYATNYGDIFNVRFEPEPENLADSDRGLGLHTDNPYRDPVPGYQILHVLKASDEGGESIFADGFAIASHLRAEYPSYFDSLTRVPVPFHYRSRNAELFSEKPLIQLALRGDIEAVHYNSRAMSPLWLSSDAMPSFYEAYRCFASMVRDSRFHLQFKLDSGEAAVFDNHRVLHGRTAFLSQRYSRLLQGCYLTKDSVRSGYTVLRRRLTGGL